MRAAFEQVLFVVLRHGSGFVIPDYKVVVNAIYAVNAPADAKCDVLCEFEYHRRFAIQPARFAKSEAHFKSDGVGVFLIRLDG